MDAADLTIRASTRDDAEAMGRLHVRAWQSAYRGVMPDDHLDALDPAQRADWWRSVADRTDLPPVLVAIVGEEVAGFAAIGAEAGSESGGCGQLYATNLDPDYWGRGIGRRLLRAATAELVALGYDEAVLWVVVQNSRARRLYESDGWAPDGGESSEDFSGVAVDEVRYRRALTPRGRAT